MSTLIVLTLGIFLFLGAMAYLFRRQTGKKVQRRGDTIARNIASLEEEKKKSRLEKGLFFRIKSGLFRK